MTILADAAADPGPPGPTRRRLGQWLLASPWPGALAPSLAGAAAAAGAPVDGHPSAGRWVHAFAAYGLPKYGPDFTHFDYVDLVD
jgi:hypothetical protein